MFHKCQEVRDLFGPWDAADGLPLMELPPFPGATIQPQQVLEHNFDLEQDGSLPFSVFDELMDKHNIDVSGLTMSNTARGNQFRTHRLMRLHQ